jgi:hypothetical protein
MAMLDQLRAAIKAHPQARAGDLIVKLNPTGTSITCNDEWMEEARRCQTWRCCT